MYLKQLTSIVFILSLTSFSQADAFAEMEADSSREARTYAELDAETGSCLTELREHNQRATKVLAVLKKKKQKIAKLEGKVERLTAKLIDRPEPKACDTAGLNQKIVNLQNQNVQLSAELTRLRSAQTGSQNHSQAALLSAQQENLALKQQVVQLQSQLSLASSKPVAIPVAVKAAPNRSAIDAEVVDADWDWTAKQFKGRLGQDFAYSCPPKGTIHRVWGTERYTVGSSVCSAAVHRGLITAKDGGVAVIRIQGNKNRFKGSNKHGVKSGSYSASHVSYIFL